MVMTRIISLWTLAAVAVIVAPKAGAQQSAGHLFDGEDSLPAIPDDILVGAYYYPWHGSDFHRGGGYMRELLEPRHQPTLGEYDDSRLEIVGQHLMWSRQANIGAWFTSWWGPNKREDTTTRNVILEHEDIGNHKISLLYETTGRVRAKENFSMHNVKPDIEFICANYFDHPNYFRIDNRPVMLLYLTRVMHGRGLLEEIIQIMRDNCHHDIYIIGDQIWGEAPHDDEYYMPFDVLDAVTNYDVYGNINNPPYAGQAAVDKYYGRQAEWKTQANKNGVGYIPAVSPGYNDRGVRLEADHMAQSRRLTPESEPGSLLVAQLQQARYLVDSGTQKLMLVNSFNEWHEDSQIEPVIGEPTTKPEEITNGVQYIGYGELYLDILKMGTCGATCQAEDNGGEGEDNDNEPTPDDPQIIELPPDSLFSGEPPSKVLVGAIYYAWFRPDESKYLRNQLNPPQNPVFQSYADQTLTIAEHLEYSSRANIGLWLLPWMGPDHISDEAARNWVLPHPELADHKVALLYETRQRLTDDDEQSFINIGSDIEYICETYFQHPNYYRVHGRPVLFMSLTRTLYDGGLLEAVISILRNVAQTMGHEIYVVGDQVWSEVPDDEIYMPFLQLDALFNRDVYGNLLSTVEFDDGTIDISELEHFYKLQWQWRNRAWHHKCGYIPSVTPGYNDRYFADRPILRRDEGSLFSTSLEMARYLVDSDLQNLMIVNSFNNFKDDTMIEPFQGENTNDPILLTGGFPYMGYEYLYLDILEVKTRMLESDVVDPHQRIGTFEPLDCNDGLDDDACQTTWSMLFGNHNTHVSTITIPCGRCVTMDHRPGDLLSLDGGLDIQGKLQIPDNFILTIVTPFIHVQGELSMEDSQPITGQPTIRILFTASRPGFTKFMPFANNAQVCGSQRCDLGQRSLVVAGGRLNIKGIPEEIRSWVLLQDVVTDVLVPPLLDENLASPTSIACSHDGPLVRDAFQSQSGAFSGTLGSFFEFENSSLQIRRRTASFHGAQVDLKNVRQCLTSNQMYSVSMKFLLEKTGSAGRPTQCSQSNFGCLQIFVDYLSSDGVFHSDSKYNEIPSTEGQFYSKHFPILADIRFTDNELNPSNVYILLRFAGVEAGTDMVLSDFVLREMACDICRKAEPTCNDLISCNGSGEYGSGDPDLIPFEPNSEADQVEIFVSDEDGQNHFWRVVRLGDGNVPTSGIAWRVPLECILPGAVYKFRMRFRVHPNDIEAGPFEMSVYIRSHRPGQDAQERIGTCPESNGDWVSCDITFAISELLVGEDVDFVRMFLETVQASTVTYDIDDLSIEYVRMEAPVTGIWVDQVNWLAGAEVLIASHSLQWNQEQVRRLTGVVHDHRRSRTLLQLDTPILRPTTALESEWSKVEVALLSRNIVFESGPGSSSDKIGGHLVIYHTPSIEQVISGVEFRRFGQEGEYGRYPISIEHSGDIGGSVIRGNIIRDSYQRCVVVAGSQNIVVEDNVAYNVAGHCFVVQDGYATDNTFRRNLGARVKALDKILVNNFKSETDDVPAIFFSASWNNTWEHNVAAGSQGYGYLLDSSREGYATSSTTIAPADQSWKLYYECTAHSNVMAGFHIESAQNALPTPFLQLFKIKSFLNHGSGVSIRKAKDVVIDSSYMADNRKHLMLQGASGIALRGSILEGLSPTTKVLQQVQSGFVPLCQTRAAIIAGIEVQSLSPKTTSVHVEDTVMVGYSHPSDNCGKHPLFIRNQAASVGYVVGASLDVLESYLDQDEEVPPCGFGHAGSSCFSPNIRFVDSEGSSWLEPLWMSSSSNIFASSSSLSTSIKKAGGSITGQFDVGPMDAKFNTTKSIFFVDRTSEESGDHSQSPLNPSFHFHEIIIQGL